LIVLDSRPGKFRGANPALNETRAIGISLAKHPALSL
jgi:hypothetical protein